MMDAAATRYGRLDYAVNDAAWPPDRARIVDAGVAGFRRILDANLTSPLPYLKYEITQPLRQRARESVVNIGSIRSPQARAGARAYTAAKNTIIGLTRTTALKYAADGVRVNVVCPGATDTPMVLSVRAARGETEVDMAARVSLSGRLGTPHKVVAATRWLCSPDSSLMTGPSHCRRWRLPHPLKEDS
jgi:glucose 1-dehydrogenase